MVAISAFIQSGPRAGWIPPKAPSPPAALTAPASRPPLWSAIGADMIGCVRPNSSVNRVRIMGRTLPIRREGCSRMAPVRPETGNGGGGMGASGVRPFSVAVGDDVLDDLQRRLEMVRWPDEIPGSAGTWRYGTDLAYLQDLMAYWRDGYDWRAQEKAINGFPQFQATVGDVDVHFLHVEGTGPDPLPLLLCHGWPGSFWEFHRLIPLLREDFTLVVPSLPGYGFSFRPNQRRCNIEAMGSILGELMTSVLGYRRFGVQGGDCGAGVASRVAHQHPGKVAGLHRNLLFPRPGNKPGQEGEASDEERRAQEQIDEWFKEGT